MEGFRRAGHKCSISMHTIYDKISGLNLVQLECFDLFINEDFIIIYNLCKRQYLCSNNTLG